LESYLQKYGYVKEPEAVRLIEEVARGCEYLYNKGIFHRDIKTENILLSENRNPILLQMW
jgi:serine/threonine protein kinase